MIIRSGRDTLNVAGCIQVVSFSFFFHGLVYVERLLPEFPFPQVKSCHLSAALLGEDSEISQEQLYELLKYAALGKCHNAAQPRYSHSCSQPALLFCPGVKAFLQEYWPCWVWSSHCGVAIMAAWIVQILLLDLARKQNSSSVKNPTIPEFCFMQF